MHKEEIKLTPDQEAEAKDLAKDVDKYSSLTELATTAGGKLLISGSLEDILNIIDVLRIQYKTASHQDLVGLLADLDSKYSILQSLTNAKENKEGASMRLARVLQGLSADPDE